MKRGVAFIVVKSTAKKGMIPARVLTCDSSQFEVYKIIKCQLG